MSVAFKKIMLGCKILCGWLVQLLFKKSFMEL